MDVPLIGVWFGHYLERTYMAGIGTSLIISSLLQFFDYVGK
jgi:hypothetical protein